MQNHPATTRPIDREMAVEAGRTAQQRFERARAAEAQAGHATPLAGIRAWIASLFGGRGEQATVGRAGAQASSNRSTSDAASRPRHLEGLEAAGCVVLACRRLAPGRRVVDHVVVAPSGIHVIVNRPWRGQVSVTDDQLYVDGRSRAGAPEQARAAAAALQDLLADELRPQAVPVIPTLCLLNAEARWQSWQVQGVEVIPGRGLARYMRGADPVMGQETMVRVALAADRLLEHA